MHINAKPRTRSETVLYRGESTLSLSEISDSESRKEEPRDGKEKEGRLLGGSSELDSQSSCLCVAVGDDLAAGEAGGRVNDEAGELPQSNNR